MNVPADSTCTELRDQLDELVVGDPPAPLRARLLAHAAGCATCRAELDELVRLTDHLLDLAPQHEPPPGFESRVLDRWRADAGGHRALRRWLAVAAAVLLLASVAGGFAWGRVGRGGEVAAARQGRIVTAAGAQIGTVQLVRGVRPYAVVTIDEPRAGGGAVQCRFLLADGRRVTVGSWGYDDIRGNVWAVGVDAEVMGAVAMQVVGPDGQVVATATLD